MSEEQKKALDDLAEITQEFEKANIAYEAKVDEWWDSITTEEREMAFYSICKRIYEAELQDGGTYRHALYDVFGFDGGMYGRGMNCGFMAIHNAIGDGEDYQAMRGVNRLEVIDDTGRALVKYFDKGEKLRYELQDDNQTLKIFVDKVNNVFTENL
jgi:hypothetical protein